MVDTEDEKRRQEAAAWFSRLNQRRVSSEDIHAFAEWRRAPENAEAYARAERLWEKAGGLAADPEIQRLTRDAARPGPGHRNVRWFVLGGAGAAAALLGAIAWGHLGPKAYGTETGERRTVMLADGSSVTLDTDSRISVRLTGDRRAIELLRGRAMFDVARDVSRPFVVEAGPVEVTALGTRFDVRRYHDGASVTLAEGRVSVADERTERDWTLSPGQQLTATARAPSLGAVNVEATTSWTEGRLVFDHTPLSQAVGEMNRYASVKLELRSSTLATAPISGVFNTGDMEAFAGALSDLYPLSLRRSDGRLVLSDAPGN